MKQIIHWIILTLNYVFKKFENFLNNIKYLLHSLLASILWDFSILAYASSDDDSDNGRDPDSINVEDLREEENHTPSGSPSGERDWDIADSEDERDRLEEDIEKTRDARRNDPNAMNDLRRDYPAFFDEDSGHDINTVEGRNDALDELENYLKEERRAVSDDGNVLDENQEVENSNQENQEVENSDQENPSINENSNQENPSINDDQVVAGGSETINENSNKRKRSDSTDEEEIESKKAKTEKSDSSNSKKGGSDNNGSDNSGPNAGGSSINPNIEPSGNEENSSGNSTANSLIVRYLIIIIGTIAEAINQFFL
jgi:hypothetical protein